MFQTDTAAKVLLAQISIANEGFDGSVANIVVFYTPVASPKMRKQCIGRIKRKGQKKKMVVVDFIMKNSSDQSVSKNREKRIGLVKSVMEYIQDFNKRGL
jgi:ERCC4-related helicase